ncbi:MAG: LysR family transcriptional regulator [Polaromonas sp.]|uniref:LysR family transcriptional regulator n=1 Tax=Polaromonas sp. TaxID=1869339 RepID=UPI00272FBF96|nr:LysR family transcriptional regulator [Polaromonas sp.]MDP2256373.1 LysR family transcriptional regulator [Polaromonas sp.]MDP3709339.1 LysR family transcriptional regulator [Polaromonas sp.]
MKPIDIRLLSVFDEIYKTRSVTAAALALNLGQPAVSIALSKLRQQLGDPLFVRTSSGMEPTPFGEGLVRPVRAVLDALDLVLGHRNEFDPATSRRTFRICMTDISQLVLLPRLWKTLRVSAPGIHIEIFPLSKDTAQLLETGEADLAMGLMPQLEAGFYQQLLFRQSFVCMVGADHPRITDQLSLAQFEAEDHVVVSSSGSAPLVLDREIARLGIKRRIALQIPNFLGAAFVVEHTDHIITIPERLGDVLQGRGAFRIFPVPFALPDYEVKQHWHERYHHDPGSRWLRGVISGLLSE